MIDWPENDWIFSHFEENINWTWEKTRISQVLLSLRMQCTNPKLLWGKNLLLHLQAMLWGCWSWGRFSPAATFYSNPHTSETKWPEDVTLLGSRHSLIMSEHKRSYHCPLNHFLVSSCWKKMKMTEYSVIFTSDFCILFGTTDKVNRLVLVKNSILFIVWDENLLKNPQ